MFDFPSAKVGQRAAVLATACAAAIVLLVGARIAQATVFPAVGGQGDRAELLNCPTGQLLVGFHGRTGAWIDQIGLICAEVLPGYAIGRGERQPARGGQGGGPVDAYCDTDGAIRSIDPFVWSENGKAKVVSHVNFSCSKPKDGSDAGQYAFQSARTPVEFDDIEITLVQHCPGNEYATGLSVRYGAHVNAFGLICSAVEERPPVAQPSAPPPPPPGIEPNIDRPGSDYDMFNPESAQACQRECQYQRDRCKAWTYVRPGIQGPRARCYLKDAVPPPVPNSCCDSGVPPSKTHGTALKEDGGVSR